MPDEQAAAKGGRMLLWRLLHHSCKLELNKIAARWPAKAVAQFYFTNK